MSSPERFLGHPVEPKLAIQPHRDVKLVGKYVTILGLQSSHIPSLYGSVGGMESAPLWDFMLHGPFPTLDSFRAQMEKHICSEALTMYTVLVHASDGKEKAVVDPDTGLRAVGMLALHRVDLPNRVVEIGHVIYGPSLARSAAATEAMYLLAKHVFEDLNFRRYEWKANSLNGASATAAVRLGFTYEGTFRQHMLVRGGLNRDTIWYSILDSEWEMIKNAFEGWLSSDNFDDEGRQKKKLQDFRK